LLGIMNCWIWTKLVDGLHDVHECVVKEFFDFSLGCWSKS
jgi:hypothetical protein